MNFSGEGLGRTLVLNVLPSLQKINLFGFLNQLIGSLKQALFFFDLSESEALL